ncbi:MAG: heavy-metal-associated domain-containing protein, partial [Sulfobacillus sp.]
MDQTKYHMDIEGMTCTDCEHHVTKALESVGANNVQANFRRGEAIFWAPANFSEDAARQAVEQAGYRPQDIDVVASQDAAATAMTYDMDIEGMTCTDCEHHVTKAL